MPTRVVCNVNNGETYVEVDYDATNRITAVRCINGADQPALVKSMDGRTSLLVQPHSTGEIAIPLTGLRRITQVRDTVRQRWSGIDLMLSVPGA